MSKRTSKYTIKEKVDMIHQVLSDHQSIHSVSNYYRLGKHTLKEWIHRYETGGVDVYGKMKVQSFAGRKCRVLHCFNWCRY